MEQHNIYQLLLRASIAESDLSDILFTITLYVRKNQLAADERHLATKLNERIHNLSAKMIIQQEHVLDTNSDSSRKTQSAKQPNTSNKPIPEGILERPSPNLIEPSSNALDPPTSNTMGPPTSATILHDNAKDGDSNHQADQILTINTKPAEVPRRVLDEVEQSHKMLATEKSTFHKSVMDATPNKDAPMKRKAQSVSRETAAKRPYTPSPIAMVPSTLNVMESSISNATRPPTDAITLHDDGKDGDHQADQLLTIQSEPVEITTNLDDVEQQPNMMAAEKNNFHEPVVDPLSNIKLEAALDIVDTTPNEDDLDDNEECTNDSDQSTTDIDSDLESIKSISSLTRPNINILTITSPQIVSEFDVGASTSKHAISKTTPLNDTARKTPVTNTEDEHMDGAFKVLTISVRQMAREMKAIKKQHHKDLQQLKQSMASAEAANASGFATVMENHSILLEHCRSLAQDTEVLKVSNGILTTKTDFEEPSWPLRTSDMVIELNYALKQPEYRNFVFARLKEWCVHVPENIRKATKKYMERLFDYESLIHFSWSGKTSIDEPKTNKLQFEELGEIVKLIMDLTKSPDSYEEIKYFMKRVPQCFRAKKLNLNT